MQLGNQPRFGHRPIRGQCMQEKQQAHAQVVDEEPRREAPQTLP